MTDASEVSIWLSTRRTFREGDEGWPKYVEFIGLASLKEVRSIDSSLNKYVEDCGSCPLQSYEDLSTALAQLPAPSGREYLLLYVNVDGAPPPRERCTLLGYDLSDETHTSSLLNCGPWTGVLAPFTQRLNKFGLLTLNDAAAARSLLPRTWPGEPHANVTVWALYEVEPEVPRRSS